MIDNVAEQFLGVVEDMIPSRLSIFQIEQELKRLVKEEKAANLLYLVTKNHSFLTEIKDMAYQVLKFRKSENPSQEQINELLIQIKDTIKDTIKDVIYSLDKQLVKDGIDVIFEEAKKIYLHISVENGDNYGIINP